MDPTTLVTYFVGLLKAADAVVEYASKWASGLESKELATIVVRHAIAAAVSGMVGGVLPGVAALIGSGIAIGAIWHMYYAIGQYLHLEFSKDILKAIASAIIVNIVTQLAGVITMEILASFVPGLAIITNGICLFGNVFCICRFFLRCYDLHYLAAVIAYKLVRQRVKAHGSSAVGAFLFFY